MQGFEFFYLPFEWQPVYGGFWKGSKESSFQLFHLNAHSSAQAVLDSWLGQESAGALCGWSQVNNAHLKNGEFQDATS